jgi:UDP-N-acetyl-D-mannosaminuronic acid dehydrogenase
MAEVCVFGLGYVGLPTASLLASAGLHVLGVDTDARVVENLREGRTRLGEAGLATLVSAAVHSGNLVARSRPEPSETHIICVPTPTAVVAPASGGAPADHRVDLTAVIAVARTIAQVLRPGDMVILESTSPVGTTRDVVGRILRETGLEPGRDFDLCYCPERVLPGNTARELVGNSRIIGGFTPRAAQRAKAMYARFCDGEMIVTDDRTAELCKLMENTFRDVNVALANVFARLAEQRGIDVWKAIEFANLHPRVDILKPGPGVGGHCIPVDPWFLIEQFPHDTALLRAARETNDGQGVRMLERLWRTGRLRRGDRIALLGAAYKADIDDARESPAFTIAEAARRRGLEVLIHDPHVEPGTHHGFTVVDDLARCLDGAAAAILVTDHREYKALPPRTFLERMRGRLIGDCRNWLDQAPLRDAGFTVLCTGIGGDEWTEAAAPAESSAPEVQVARGLIATPTT